MRLKGYRSTNPVAVGDLVDYDTVEDGTGVISNIHERTNCIVRKSVNLSMKAMWWRPTSTGRFSW